MKKKAGRPPEGKKERIRVPIYSADFVKLFIHNQKAKKPMDEIEVLARAWMVCDPNRQPAEPDAIIHRVDDSGKSVGTYNGQPEWKWFVPRAEATIEFLNKNGFQITKS